MSVAVVDPDDEVPDGFDALYVTHATRLRRLIARRVGDPHLAEDIVQETFLRAHRFRDRLDPGRPAWPWLRTIAVRLAANATRRPHVAAEQLLAEHAEGDTGYHEGPGDDVERRMQRDVLVEMLASMPERQRRLLVLHDMYGVGCDELAETEGARATALRMACSRARVALRNHTLASRLGALAPLGWGARALRRLRRGTAGLGAAPAGAIVVSAIVVVAALSAGIDPPAPSDAGPDGAGGRASAAAAVAAAVEPVAHRTAAGAADAESAGGIGGADEPATPGNTNAPSPGTRLASAPPSELPAGPPPPEPLFTDEPMPRQREGDVERIVRQLQEIEFKPEDPGQPEGPSIVIRLCVAHPPTSETSTVPMDDPDGYCGPTLWPTPNGTALPSDVPGEGAEPAELDPDAPEAPLPDTGVTQPPPVGVDEDLLEQTSF